MAPGRHVSTAALTRTGRPPARPPAAADVASSTLDPKLNDPDMLAAMGFVPAETTMDSQAQKPSREQRAHSEDESHEEAKPTASPADTFELSTFAQPNALPHRAVLESRLGQDLSHVQAHLGTPEAQEGLEAMEAHAAAVSHKVAFVETDRDLENVAHEVAQILQSQASGQSAVNRLSSPDEATEQEADRGAKDVTAVRQTAVGVAASAGTVHRGLWRKVKKATKKAKKWVEKKTKQLGRWGWRT